MHKYKVFPYDKDFSYQKRLVYQKTGSPRKGAETPSGAPEAINAMTDWKEDMQKTFGDLAKEAFPDNTERQEEYRRQIEDSLINHLAAGRTMEDLWVYLKEESCKIAAIMQGFLNFYREVEGEREKINIDDFFNIGTFDAETPLDREYAEKREELVNKLKPQTKANLKSFLEELKKSLPDLPNYPQ